MAFAVVIYSYNQSVIEEENGLSDSLDQARTLLSNRKSLAWRLLQKLNYFLTLGNKVVTVFRFNPFLNF